MAAGGLAEIFLRERPWTAAQDELEQQLAQQLAAARTAWPTVDLDAGRFVAHVAARLPAGAGAAELAALRAADLYLACACADGDQAAMRLFEQRYFGEIDDAAARLRAGTDLAAEVKQMLRRILFVSEGERAAAAGEFAGRGDLRGWVKVSAVRELQRLLGKGRREVRVDDDAFLDMLGPDQDAELAYLRDRYRREIKAALGAAMAAAGDRERAVLRYNVIDGLNIEEIGKIYGVHRATVARWIANAREGIFERVKAELSSRYGIGAGELESILRLVQSRLEISLERVLG